MWSGLLPLKATKNNGRCRERGLVCWYRGIEVYSCEFSEAELGHQQAKLRSLKYTCYYYVSGL